MSADIPEIQFRSDVTVELVKASASDADVVFAARVSTQGEQSLGDAGAAADRSRGLINYLMRDRHGARLPPTTHNTRACRWLPPRPNCTGAGPLTTCCLLCWCW